MATPDARPAWLVVHQPATAAVVAPSALPTTPREDTDTAAPARSDDLHQAVLAHTQRLVAVGRYADAVDAVGAVKDELASSRCRRELVDTVIQCAMALDNPTGDAALAAAWLQPHIASNYGKPQQQATDWVVHSRVALARGHVPAAMDLLIAGLAKHRRCVFTWRAVGMLLRRIEAPGAGLARYIDEAIIACLELRDRPDRADAWVLKDVLGTVPLPLQGVADTDALFADAAVRGVLFGNGSAAGSSSEEGVSAAQAARRSFVHKHLEQHALRVVGGMHARPEEELAELTARHRAEGQASAAAARA